MCWVCERLENLIVGWNEERNFQEQTSSDDFHRGLSKGFSECVTHTGQVWSVRYEAKEATSLKIFNPIAGEMHVFPKRSSAKTDE
jgi:hypothetical protein